MKKQIIKSDAAPAPVGPYSQAVGAGPFLFCSGQIPLDAKTGEMIKGSIQDQARKVLENIHAVLDEAGLDFSAVVKSTIFLTNMNDFSAVNEIYSGFFENHFPARSTVEVSALPKGAQVEIEVIAQRE